jgi:hypothetical protein
MPPSQKLIQTVRDEVNTCFSEIIQEVKQLQIKVLDFVEKEEAAALGKLDSSIQQSHNRLLKLEGDSVWLHTLLANRSDERFLQARPLSSPGSVLTSASLLPMYRCTQSLDKVISYGLGRGGVHHFVYSLPQGPQVIIILSSHQHPSFLLYHKAQPCPLSHLQFPGTEINRVHPRILGM